MGVPGVSVIAGTGKKADVGVDSCDDAFVGNGVKVGNGVMVGVLVAVVGVTMAVCVSKKACAMVLTADVIKASISISSVSEAPPQPIRKIKASEIYKIVFIFIFIRTSVHYYHTRK